MIIEKQYGHENVPKTEKMTSKRERSGNNFPLVFFLYHKYLKYLIFYGIPNTLKMEESCLFQNFINSDAISQNLAKMGLKAEPFRKGRGERILLWGRLLSSSFFRFTRWLLLSSW